jgi:hypothetical protein
VIVLGEAHLRRILKSYADYYNGVRTHRSLNKDAPVSRLVRRAGVIRSRAILGVLHHHYVRVQVFGTHREPLPGAPASTAACCAVMVECHVAGMVALLSTDSHNAPWARVRQPCGGRHWLGRSHGRPALPGCGGIQGTFRASRLTADGRPPGFKSISGRPDFSLRFFHNNERRTAAPCRLRSGRCSYCSEWRCSYCIYCSE